MTETIYHICGKCGKPATATQAQADGWLIAQRKGKPEGWLIIRCPDHTTDHVRRQAGLKQQYYHQHKAQQTTCQFCQSTVFTDDREVGSVRQADGSLKHYHLECLYAAHPGENNYNALAMKLFSPDKAM